MLKKEKKLMEFCEKHYLMIAFLLITVLSLAMRYFMRGFESGDYIDFLETWFDYLKEGGGLKALRDYPGDYNASYMTIMALLTYLPINKLYLIKGVSILFDFALAFSSGLLAREIVTDKKKKDILFFITYAVILMLPSVMMNSALWAQCDSIYTTFVILALLFLIKEKYVLSFIMLGLAFSFKLQFIFILPLFIILYVTKKKYSILHFFIIPLTNLVMCIPAILCGNSIIKCMSVYFKQTSTYNKHLVLNFPNIYNLINGYSEIFYKVGSIFAILICILSLVYVLYKKVKWNNEKIITLGLWFIVILTFVLPGMHERYMYCGEVLAVIYYICYRKNLPLIIFLILSPVVTYSGFLHGLSFNYLPLFSIIYTILIVYYTKYTLSFLES